MTATTLDNNMTNHDEHQHQSHGETWTAIMKQDEALWACWDQSTHETSWNKRMNRMKKDRTWTKMNNRDEWTCMEPWNIMKRKRTAKPKKSEQGQCWTSFHMFMFTFWALQVEWPARSFLRNWWVFLQARQENGHGVWLNGWLIERSWQTSRMTKAIR